MRLLLLLVALVSANICAREAVFGLELTFTRQLWLRDDLNLEATIVQTAVDVAEQIVRNCRGQCKRQGTRIEFSDGFIFEITTDPGVLEVRTKPATLSQIRSHEAKFQLLWQVMANNHLRPNPDQGGGHINIDYDRSFASDIHRRNFMVDYNNHPELALGAHLLDQSNAPPLALLSLKAKKSYLRIIKKLDAGELSLRTAIARTRSEVYQDPSNKFPIGEIEDASELSKYHALNLDHISESSPLVTDRFEIRAVRSQETFADVISDLELYQARIDYLEELSKTTLITPDIPKSFKGTAELRASFKRYIEESGLRWKNYFNYLPRSWDKYLAQWGLSCRSLQLIYSGY